MYDVTFYHLHRTLTLVVAIDIAYQKHDGKLLWQAQPQMPYLPPHPVLLDFHLALSVMKHMLGAAEYNEDFNGPDSDFSDATCRSLLTD